MKLLVCPKKWKLLPNPSEVSKCTVGKTDTSHEGAGALGVQTARKAGMILRVAFISALAALAVQMVGMELMTRYGLEHEVEAFLGTTAKTPSVPITGRRQLLSSPGGWNSGNWDLSPADPTQSSCTGSNCARF